MEHKIVADFDTRREAEAAIEHLVQEHGVEPTDISVRASGEDNTAGVRAAGADVESGHRNKERRGQPELAGPIELAVGCRNAESTVIEHVLKGAGGKHLRAG